jgi:spermidine synthase
MSVESEKRLTNDRWLLLAFTLSGAAALGYEVLWTRLLGLALGNETLGILGVLGGFFGGLALGAWLLHDRARNATHPARLFAILETIAALFALASPHLLYWLANRLPPLLGTTAANNDTPVALLLSLAISGAALLPGTACMGATIATLVEARRRAFGNDTPGRGLGRLYAANTFGATLGVLGSVYLVLPWFGMAAGSVVLSCLGLAAAACALYWDRRQSSPAPVKLGAGPEPSSSQVGKNLYSLLFLTGLVGVGLEVVGIHILAQNFQDTVYTFANVLAVYLLGTAAGAWLFAWATPRISGTPRQATTGALLLALALTAVLSGFALAVSGPLLDLLAPPGSGYAWNIVAEFIVSATVFLAPTMLMGALFSHLTSLVEGRGVGRAYALNTLGGALAPFIFGLWAIRSLGYAWALYLAGMAYLAMLLALPNGAAWRLPRRLGAAALVLALLLAAPRSLMLVPVTEGWSAVARYPGLMGLVTVREAPSVDAISRRLMVNRNFRMGGDLSFGEQRMGHLPLLLAPRAKNALYLGVGTGATLSAVRHYPLDRVDAVEIVPEIISTLRYFEHVNDMVYLSSNVWLHAADARRYLTASGQKFDVIVADLFHPARDGAGSLYSLEHFRQVRSHLSPDGLFAQWIPLYQFDTDTLRTVIRTFLAVFPEAHSILGLYSASTPPLVLIGRAPSGDDGLLVIDTDVLRQRLADPAYKLLLMQDPRDLLAGYMLDREGLRDFAGDGPLNTDLNPRVLFDAPRSAYERNPALAYGALEELMALRTPVPHDLLVSGNGQPDDAMLSGVGKFSAALGHYIQGEIARVRAPGITMLPREVIDHYLRAYEAEPDFRAAAGLLFALATGDPEAADYILPRMLARTPDNWRVYEQYVQYLEKGGHSKRLEDLLDHGREHFGTAGADR